jgi:hypothetical protein
MINYEKLLSQLGASKPEDLKAADEIYQGLIKSADALSAEEISSLCQQSPTLGREFAKLLLKAQRQLDSQWQLLASFKKPNDAQAKDMEAFWRTFWAMSHLFVLCGAAGVQPWVESYAEAQLEAGNWLTHRASLYGVPVVTARAWWGLSQVLQEVSPLLRSTYRAADNPFRAIDAGAPLLLQVAKYPEKKAEVSKLLMRPADTDKSRQQTGQFLSGALDALPNFRPVHIKRGQTAALRNAPLFDEGSPYRVANAEATPASLAMRLGFYEDCDYLNDEQALVSLLSSISCIPEAKAEDLYLPADYLAKVHKPWKVEDTQQLLARFQVYFGLYTPAKAVQTQGRNEMCACGSGKKFKKCHGA